MNPGSLYITSNVNDITFMNTSKNNAILHLTSGEIMMFLKKEYKVHLRCMSYYKYRFLYKGNVIITVSFYDENIFNKMRFTPI